MSDGIAVFAELFEGRINRRLCRPADTIREFFDPFDNAITVALLVFVENFEQEELNQAKATTAKTYVDAGVIDGADARQVLVADKNGNYTTLDAELPDGIEGAETDQEGNGDANAKA